MKKESLKKSIKKPLLKSNVSGRFKKGDKFKTPSGIIKIMSIARETKNHGSGYRIGSVIIPFDELEKNVKNKVWEQIK